MRLALALSAAAVALVLPAATSAGQARITVYAAASLTGAFPKIDRAPRYSFAGSDQLAFQITQGAPADVYAAASPKYPDKLFADGLVEKPRAFATNELVLIVPRENEAGIHSVFDLQRNGIRIVIAAKGVPVGDYTRDVLGHLGPEGAAILRNVRSEEPDVKGIVAKLTQSAADAGFVYITDVNATKGALRAIELPASAQPRVVYAGAVVKGTKHPDEAKAFIDGLLSGRGAQALRAAGFEPPPA